MDYSFDKIIIYYKNNKMHHAKIKYRKIYGPGRVVDLEKEVYPKEFDNELRKIIHYYRSIGNYSFDIQKLIEFSDFEKTSKISSNNQVLTHVESINNQSYDMMDRIRKKLESKNIRIKKIGAAALSLMLAISGIGYTVSRAKPKENSMEKYYKSVMYINDNYNVALSDIDNILEIIDNLKDTDTSSLYEKLNFCKMIINTSMPDIPFSQIVVNKFLNLGGLLNKDIMSDSGLKHLCMYGVNLIMGGDNYGNLYNSSDIIAMNLNTNKDDSYYKYLSYISNRYNISGERAEYSAVYAEAVAYESLPLIIKYIILTQVEKAIVKAHFDFEDKKIMPTWWVNLDNKYDYDKLLAEIRAKKEDCKAEIYNTHVSSEAKDNGKLGHLK